MLNFIGCGNSFNTKLGNNSAYRKDGHHLFMIDCGSANFHRILASGLLSGVSRITVLMTHLHPDHVGSLGDLIFYAYFHMAPAFAPKVTVLTPAALTGDFKTVMTCVGVTQDKYTHVGLTGPYAPFDLCGITNLQAIRVEHAKELTCYGYLLHIEGQRVYYSGDCRDIPQDMLERLKQGTIDVFYQDTCTPDIEGNVHMSLRQLTERIPDDLRDRVYCMHLDDQFPLAQVQDLGFHVVSTF